MFFRSQKPSQQALLDEQTPAPDIDLPRTILNIIQFAETKQIFDHVLQAYESEKIRSISILSELPREGRTLFSAALATSFGQLVRKKVLVVDCSTFASPNSLSLERLLESDELQIDRKNQQAVFRTLSVNVSLINMRAWADDRGTTAEYEAAALIEEYSKKFDLIIFDTCAMSARNRNNLDPITIARRCDSAILLITRRSSARTSLNDLRERLRKEKLKLMGVAVNEGALA